MNYNITIDGEAIAFSLTDDAQIAAVDAARVKRNESCPEEKDSDGNVIALEDRAGFFATADAYLQNILQIHRESNPETTAQDLIDTAKRAAANWAGQDAPPPAPVPEMSPEAQKAALRAYAADKRWRVEVGGITLGGMRVSTDGVAQRKISELRRRVESGEVAVPFGFKAASGWIDLGLEQIVAVDRAVAAHVAAGYARERIVCAAIEAETITAQGQIDAAAWPSN